MAHDEIKSAEKADMIGHRTWVIPEGYIPGCSFSDAPELISHEAACILNAADTPAASEITCYFADREPVGPYRLKLDPRRTRRCALQRSD